MRGEPQLGECHWRRDVKPHLQYLQRSGAIENPFRESEQSVRTKVPGTIGISGQTEQRKGPENPHPLYTYIDNTASMRNKLYQVLYVCVYSLQCFIVDDH